MSTHFENMGADEANHIDLFVKYFVNKNKRSRWRTILSMKPAKWVGVSAYDCSQAEVSDWNTPVNDTIMKLGLEKYLDHNAYIFPIGRAAHDGVYESTTRKALLSEDSEIECIISIIPGRLAICYGHSNEFRLCRRYSGKT